MREEEAGAGYQRRLLVPLAKDFAKDSAVLGGRLLNLSRIVSAGSSAIRSPRATYRSLE
jgi:hypothetical protein